MNDDLYFVPILSEAVAAPDPSAAMKTALAIISDLGGAAGRRVGYRQWLQFLAESAVVPNEAERAALGDAALMIAVARLAAETLDSELHVDDSARPQASFREDAYLQALDAARGISDRVDSLALLIHREDQPVASLSLHPVDRTLVTGMRPGQYTLALDTGRLLWSGTITPSELVWRHAFPKRPLTMAADSTARSLSPTKSIPLSVGALVLAVYPGVETGAVQLRSGGAA